MREQYSATTRGNSDERAAVSGLYEERRHLPFAHQCCHRPVVWPWPEVRRRFEHEWKERHVSDGIEERSRPSQHPVHGLRNVRRLREWLVPGRVRVLFFVPWPERDALDRLEGDLPGGALAL